MLNTLNLERNVQTDENKFYACDSVNDNEFTLKVTFDKT